MRPQKNRGGTLKETTLWTNSAPTSNFASQTVTLSEDITTFDYIRVYYNVSRTVTKEVSALMSVSDFLTITTAYYEPRFMIGNVGGTYNYFRQLRQDSNTTTYISAAYNTNGTTDNAQIIPTKITGCKL